MGPGWSIQSDEKGLPDIVYHAIRSSVLCAGYECYCFYQFPGSQTDAVAVFQVLFCETGTNKGGGSCSLRELDMFVRL